MGRAREIADLIGGTTPDIILKTSDGAILNLQTSDTTVTSSSVLGAINFQAPDEASGTDAIELPVLTPNLVLLVPTVGVDNEPSLAISNFESAAALAPVEKTSFVLLLSAAKVSSATASIFDAIRIESVPLASSGAWKFIAPKTLSAVTVVSLVCKFSIAPSEVFRIISGVVPPIKSAISRALPIYFPYVGFVGHVTLPKTPY